MCGIIAGITKESVAPFLVMGLKQLEYRGYDSSGVVVLQKNAFIRIRKIGPKNIDVLGAEIGENNEFKNAQIGIAHTRWATHGGVSVENAHPHIGPDRIISLVHNGIIENYTELKKEIDISALTGQTDTEVLAHYFEKHIRAGELMRDSLHRMIPDIRGEWNVVLLKNTSELVAARYSGQILIVGKSEEGVFVASDEQALPESVQQIYEIPYGYMCEIKNDTIHFYDSQNKSTVCMLRPRVVFPVLIIEGEMMGTEIREQSNTLHALVRGANAQKEVLEKIYAALKDSTVYDIVITACGTSLNAGLCVAKEWEKIFQKPVSVIIASEMESVMRNLEHTVLIAISQSGSTQDVLDAIAHAQKMGTKHTIAITNKKYSAIKEKANILFDVCAGPEFGVAASKTFTHTLLSLLLVSRSVLENDIERILPELKKYIEHIESSMNTWAQKIMHAQTTLYLGKHSLFPIAIEGALKLKEISYIHAESFAAGELKHGPIALIEKSVPVIVLVQGDMSEELVLGSIREVQARGAEVYVLAEDGVVLESVPDDHIVRVPEMNNTHQVFFTIPLQLLAYYTAKARGLDPDKPRNLAKSVTVK